VAQAMAKIAFALSQKRPYVICVKHHNKKAFSPPTALIVKIRVLLPIKIATIKEF
jgi:hypothetical protein